MVERVLRQYMVPFLQDNLEGIYCDGTGCYPDPDDHNKYNKLCSANPPKPLPQVSTEPHYMWELPTTLKECLPATKNWDNKNDANCLWNVLATYLPLTPFNPPNDRPVWIADIACGSAGSAKLFFDFFEGDRTETARARSAAYIGVDDDSDRGAIAKAIDNNFGYPEIKFKFGDARNLEAISEGKKFNVILLRHPGPIHKENEFQVWRDIIEEAYRYLSDGGILIMTSYYCDEHMFVRDVLLEKGAEEYIGGENPFVHCIVDNWPRDRFVSIFGRGK